MFSEIYHKLSRHIGHDVYIDVAGYDAPVCLRCRTCDSVILEYVDPQYFGELPS